MSMTKEEAIKILEHLAKIVSSGDYQETFKMAASALLPITREQVERMRGEWIDTDGEKVPVDKYGNTRGWAECSVCGEYLTASEEYNCAGHFCPACGAPMTDEAVEILVKRMEEIRNV